MYLHIQIPQKIFAATVHGPLEYGGLVFTGSLSHFVLVQRRLRTRSGPLMLKIVVIYEAGMGGPLLSSGSKMISTLILPKFQERFPFALLLRGVIRQKYSSEAGS
jgi:hypothetical protein